VIARGVLLSMLVAASAYAHPMGNFSIGQHATLTASRDGLALRYVLDFAEVPTYQLKPELKLLPAQAITQELVEAYRAAAAPAWLGKLALTVDGQPMALVIEHGRASMTPGAGGLPTVRFETLAHGAWPFPAGQAAHQLAYRDENFPERVGWKEVVLAAGAGVRVSGATVSDQDRTAALTKYPDEGTAAPMAVREARATLVVQPATRDPRVAAAPGEGSVTKPPPPASGSGELDRVAHLMAGLTAALAVVGVLAARRRRPRRD
jgi:nickel/cobalt exporter